MQYIEVMTGLARSDAGSMPFPADRYMTNYLYAPSPNLDATALERARSYVGSVAFRKLVYGKLFSAQSHAAFWATPYGQELLRAQPDAQPKPESPKRSGKLAVFGFELDAALDPLPACGLMQLEHTSTSCIRSVLLGANEDYLKRVTGKDKPPAGVRWVSVLLADTSCPSWVADCTLVFSVQGGKALAVELATTGDEGTIVSKLSPRFGAPKVDGWSSCMNSPHKGKNHKWSADGLHVNYMPYGKGNCERGYVSIETNTFRSLRKKVDESEPQI